MFGKARGRLRAWRDQRGVVPLIGKVHVIGEVRRLAEVRVLGCGFLLASRFEVVFDYQDLIILREG